MVFFFSLFYSKTPKIRDSEGNIKPKSVTTLEKVALGGINQSILIRGHDISAPILLFLHGGPGFPEMGVAYKFQRKLEEHFIVVNWDQRGAGKSFSKKIPEESMTIEQFVSDALELIQLLRERFEKEKIYLVGHSWGSALGLLLIHRYPELFFAYIGIGQVIDPLESEHVSLEFVQSVAKDRRNKKAIKELAEIQLPYGKNINALLTQRKWLQKFGGTTYEKGGMFLFKIALGSPESSFKDVFNLFKCLNFSLENMNTEIEELKFFKTIPEVSIPVYFCIGRHDYQVSFELAERYFNQLQAPQKKLIWFENSAHLPHLEEPEKFDDVMISMVLPETYLEKEL